MALWLRDCWYVAATSEELLADKAVDRTLLGRRVAMYRTQAGQPVALFNQCPHRFAPLHLGRVVGSALECPYHGLRFGASGACVHNPHGDGLIPPGAQVSSYPMIERYGFVWIWMGNPALADPAKIPDLGAIETSEPNAAFQGHMPTAANYQLVIDNLMDLSHADYVHRESLATGGSFSAMKPKVQARDETVTARWSYRTERVQPFFWGTMEKPDGPGYQSFDMTWFPGANMLLHVSARDEHRPPEADAIFTTLHLLTPETARSCHYFFAGKRNWDLASAETNEALRAGIVGAFHLEDKPILEQVQLSMGEVTDIWALNPVLLSCDPGPVHVRRLLERMIRRERRLHGAGEGEPTADGRTALLQPS